MDACSRVVQGSVKVGNIEHDACSRVQVLGASEARGSSLTINQRMGKGVKRELRQAGVCVCGGGLVYGMLRGQESKRQREGGRARMKEGEEGEERMLRVTTRIQARGAGTAKELGALPNSAHTAAATIHKCPAPGCCWHWPPSNLGITTSMFNLSRQHVLISHLRHLASSVAQCRWGR